MWYKSLCKASESYTKIFRNTSPVIDAIFTVLVYKEAAEFFGGQDPTLIELLAVAFIWAVGRDSIDWLAKRRQ